jgi:membrane dipeptidase
VAKGGVIGLSGIGPYLGGNEDLVDRLLRQILYTIDVVGPEHVGLGLDYVFDRAELDECLRKNPELFPPGIDACGGMGMVEPEAMYAIVEGLMRVPLTDAQIRGVLGENWLRIAKRVWQ